jgi:F-type H+-transporting ATPase subunit delta
MKSIITTAIELSDKQKATMEKSLAAKLKQENLELVFRVDSSVLGGIRITIGSREFDGTLKARLNSVAQQLSAHL